MTAGGQDSGVSLSCQLEFCLQGTFCTKNELGREWKEATLWDCFEAPCPGNPLLPSTHQSGSAGTVGRGEEAKES